MPDTNIQCSGLLELSLDLNQTPSIPPTLRFDIALPGQPSQTLSATNAIAPDLTPDKANAILMDYTSAVRSGHIPPLDLQVIRQQLDDRLAAQDVLPLSALETSVSHAIPATHPPDQEEQPSYMTPEQEGEYLSQLDTRLGVGDPPYLLPSHQHKDATSTPEKDKQEKPHWAELTPRELERQAELQNPQSQHSWLKHHSKLHLSAPALEVDDNESLASHDTKAAPAPRKRGGKDKHANLAKRVGDRAVGRANAGEEDDLAGGEENGSVGGGSGKKRARDPDGTYRLKGGGGKGKGGAGGGGGGGKRKRSGEDVAGGGGGGKKARLEGGGE